MATLLSICQDVAYEIGFNKPTAIIGGTSEDARKLTRLANKTGTYLMKTYPWQVLVNSQTFTAVSGSEQSSALPSDFDRFLPETFWDQTNNILHAGPITPSRYRYLQAVGNSQSTRLFYRAGGSIYMIPDMTGGESMAFEYVSKNWCQDSGATGQSAWAADDDTPVIDAELITLCMVMFYLRSRGLPSDAAKLAFDEHMGLLLEHERASFDVAPAGDIFRSNRIGGRRHFGGEPPNGTSGGLF